jgi:hypothetical protein
MERSRIRGKDNPCCKPFRLAFESCTDNEGYGALFYSPPPTGDLFIGSSLPPIKFCPWCGRGIEDNIEIPPKLRKKSGRPRLLPHQVEEIRKEEFSAKEYGEMYGVGTGCIYKIWRGER